MMTDSVEGVRVGSDGGGSGKEKGRVTKNARSWEAYDKARAAELDQSWQAAYDQARVQNANARAYDHVRAYAHARASVLLAVKASGLLALLLSTVILLGGYVQSLGKQDFFCIMAITVIQAAGIFQEWETNLQYLWYFSKIFFSTMPFLIAQIPALALVILPFVAPLWCVLLFFFLGPMACAAISSWRIAMLNHGNHTDGTESTADMMATLNIFYSLIIFQGTMALVLLLPMAIYRAIVVSRLQSLEQLSEKWGEEAIRRYISDIRARYRKDPRSIKGRDLIKYAAESLDSDSQLAYLYGARLLSAFVNKGEDVSWVLLPSRHRIQSLIDSLTISSSSRHLDETVIGSLDDKKEIRELAATIVADVAVHIDDLSNYPGAMRCISSLLQDQEEYTRTYRNRNSKRVPNLPLHQRPIGPLTESEHDEEERMLDLIRHEERRHIRLMIDQKRIDIREIRHRSTCRSKREGGTSNKLVQQGLTILERLASNSDDNRSIICSTPALLPKITAPVYSATLIQDVKTKAWADIVTRCLKVLYQLILSPDGCHEIFSNNVQALSNLKSILEMGNNEADHQELQLVAMEILTELPLDLSIKLNKEIQQVLIAKQLQLFLANGDGTAMAGRALVSLSANSESNSALIMTTQEDIIDRLTGILDDDNMRTTQEDIIDRLTAAEIMANLYAHCNVDNNTTKETLPKVLRKIMSIKTKLQESEISVGQNNPAVLGDEENQGNHVSTITEERHNISTRSNRTETEEISDQEREEQEAFLSLAQVICEKLNNADLDGAIQNAVQNENNEGSEQQRREAFVEKLKTIIEDNCHPAADSMRIVKLCSQIAKSVIRCEQYVEIFRNKGFKNSLSKASETMSELECCMRFVGTDFGPKKTVRPLFSEIEKSFGQI